MIDRDTRAAEYLRALRGLLAAPSLPFSTRLRALLPTRGGVYHIVQERPEGPVSMYVGKSGNLRRRIYDNHYKGNRGGSGLRANLLTDDLCLDEAAVTAYLGGCHAQYVLVVDGVERACPEHFAIALLRPRANR